MPRMGDLAATDVYSAFDVPLEQSTNVPGALLNAGNWFLRQAAKPEAEAQADVRNVMGALAAPVMVPGQMMKANPYPPGSEEAAFYDASKISKAVEWAPEMSLNMMGGGVAGTGEKAGTVMGSGPIRRVSALPEKAEEAFDLGRFVRDAKERHEGGSRAFYEDWAYGRIPKLTSDSADLVARWEMNDPVLNGFYKAGMHGDNVPALAPGTRYGNAPKEGRSWNYREQEYEPGVSMATVDHPDFAKYQWPDPWNKDRPIKSYEGYLLPMKGTDDEPLMVGLRGLTGKTLGSGAIDKRAAAALLATNQSHGIRAYHSSPHDFDKFDLAKIGTGEGAQVYGHGLYFAENPAVSGQGGQYWQQFLNKIGPEERFAAEKLQASGFDRDVAREALLADIAKARKMAEASQGPRADYYKATVGNNEAILKHLEGNAPVGPRTYEVNINADPAHMLDWDKPLREQQHLLDPLRSAGVSRNLLNEASGGDLYGKAAIDFHRPGLGHLDRALASEKFAEAGIPGIKYLDQGSRVGPITGQKISQIEGRLQQARADLAGGFGDPERIARNIANLEHELSLHKPTSNYVIFDPNIIRIDKKYAVPGAIGASGMGALAAQDRYQQ